jgi:hypothetical protein
MPVNFFCQPVVTSADFIAAGLHVGWIALRRATMPDTWGQDMEVPESILNSRG